MPGITLCVASKDQCPSLGQCYRAQAPGGYWQSYSDFSPLIATGSNRCPQFWPVQSQPVTSANANPGAA